MKDKQDFRENLAMLLSMNGGKPIMSMAEVEKVLRVNRRTLLADRSFPVIKTPGQYRVSTVAVARWMS